MAVEYLRHLPVPSKLLFVKLHTNGEDRNCLLILAAWDKKRAKLPFFVNPNPKA